MEIETTPWITEALRLYRRYQIEIVEACGLCPWARRARLEGSLDTRIVIDQGDAAVESSLAVIADLARNPRIEVAVVVYPRIGLARLDFDRFVARVRDSDVKMHDEGDVPFVMATFHPQATPDVTHAERLIPFLRRTPDPTIQLVRATVLDRVRAGAPQGTQLVDIAAIEAMIASQPTALPLREQIARTNLATTLRLGVAELERRLADIRRDRDETYAALAREERA
jgi:hypothetical protein